MNNSSPQASVIVRTKDSARTLSRVLCQLRAQTVAAEIIVVDSGSSDETLALASAGADQLIEIDPGRFSFGYALNVGAEAARAPIHFALSSHAFPPDEHWIEHSLSLYDRPDVAGTNGVAALPSSPNRSRTTFYQTLSDAINRPLWGFSNTGASWRAEVWEAFHFDEQLAASEDKEWGLRVLTAGWTIAFDTRLLIGDKHRRKDGLRQLYRRTHREFETIGSFVPLYAHLPSASTRDFLREWLLDIPPDAPYRGWRRRLNYFRFTELLGKYRGLRASAAVPSTMPDPRQPDVLFDSGTSDCA